MKTKKSLSDSLRQKQFNESKISDEKDTAFSCTQAEMGWELSSMLREETFVRELNRSAELRSLKNYY